MFPPVHLSADNHRSGSGSVVLACLSPPVPMESMACSVRNFALQRFCELNGGGWTCPLCLRGRAL